MNTETVKQEIASIIEETRNRIRHMRQHAPSKKYLAQLDELGLTELMPANFGNTDVQAVIAAATDAGGKQIGEGDTATSSEASKLYTLLNEKEAPAPEPADYIVLTNEDYEAVEFDADGTPQAYALTLQEAAERAKKLTLAEAVVKTKQAVAKKKSFSVWQGFSEVADGFNGRIRHTHPDDLLTNDFFAAYQAN